MSGLKWVMQPGDFVGLRKIKADPALASGVIVTTFSDVMGFLVFLGLATLFVSELS